MNPHSTALVRQPFNAALNSPKPDWLGVGDGVQ
jgi:hypothetical protein